MAGLDLARTRGYESRLLERYARVLVTSPRDKEAMASLSTIHDAEERLVVLPNGVDLDYFRPLDVLRDPATLIFTGKMSYHANVAAALDLATQVMPYVWASLPDARLVIAGKDPGPEILALAADTRIRFKLAKVTRTETDRPSFSTDDGVKFAEDGGVPPLAPEKNLNLWVCALSNGILGYAQFPGGPAATDGVVIDYRAFGTTGTAEAPFNLGRTATHEIGHYFNLRHIWADTEDCSGSDYVADTPNAAGPNYGTPAFPSVSCGNGPHGDMFMNYMDYVR